jgi:hypothetical protein
VLSQRTGDDKWSKKAMAVYDKLTGSRHDGLSESPFDILYMIICYPIYLIHRI